MEDFNKVEEAILKCPLPLLAIKNQKIIEAINKYFPYSHGMEFECAKKPSYNLKDFENIPNIMAVDVDDSEQRYRISSGLNGLICLWEVCKNLNNNSIVELESSNHYHTDMTDVWDKITNDFEKSYNDYIIKELVEWKTAFNLERTSNWYNFNYWKTLEVRIGEPTFQYSVIVKRLIQCGKIVTHLRKELLKGSEEKDLIRLQEKLNSLTKEEPIIKEDINQTVNKRIYKI